MPTPGSTRSDDPLGPARASVPRAWRYTPIVTLPASRIAAVAVVLSIAGAPALHALCLSVCGAGAEAPGAQASTAAGEAAPASHGAHAAGSASHHAHHAVEGTTSGHTHHDAQAAPASAPDRAVFVGTGGPCCPDGVGPSMAALASGRAVAFIVSPAEGVMHPSADGPVLSHGTHGPDIERAPPPGEYRAPTVLRI